MTKHDLDLLNRCHDDAVKEALSAATAIADAVCDHRKPTDDEVKRYKVARLGVESTRRDLEYCISLEFAELLST